MRGALLKLAVLVAVLVGAFTWVFGFAQVEGNGMRPTAGDGDLALFYRLDKELAARDLVVYEHDGRLLTGRIVAVPGDRVEVTEDGQLKINGYVQDTLYGQPTMPAHGGPSYPVTVGHDQYFVLGDGRTAAEDSREFGTVGIDDVQGKVITLLRRREI